MSTTSPNRCTSPRPSSCRDSIRGCPSSTDLDRPHRSGDPVRDRVPPVPWRHATVTLQTAHRYYTPPAAPGGAPAAAGGSPPQRVRHRRSGCGTGPPARPRRPACTSRTGRDTGRAGRLAGSSRSSRSGREAGCTSVVPGPAAPEEDTMKIWIVLAVAVVFVLLRLRRGQSAVVGRRLVGRDLRPAPIRIHHPIPAPSSRSTWGSSRSRSWRTCPQANTP
jgi:hypothetical protein